MEGLGLAKNAIITTPTVFIVVNGELTKQWIAPNITTAAQIKEYLAAYYNLDAAGTFVTEARKDLKTIEELAKAVASGDKFILLTSRFACPHCNRLTDPNRDDAVTKISQIWEGKFYKTTSENVAATIDETWMDKVVETGSGSIFEGLIYR